MDKTVRLINADALPRHKQLEAMGNGKYEEIEVVYASDIDNSPTIDATPVVRCKNCKHYTNPYRREKKYCTRGAYVKVNDNDYCSFGEREGDETD